MALFCSKAAVSDLEEASQQMSPVAMAAMGLVASIVAVLMMWLAAVIVNIKEAGLGRALLAVAILSIVTTGSVGLLVKLAAGGVVMVAVGFIVLAVMTIKLVFRASLWQAVGVLLLNAMMQAIIWSLYVRAMMGEDFPAGES